MHGVDPTARQVGKGREVQVPHLGEEIERHGMVWLLPVKDKNVPDGDAAT